MEPFVGPLAPTVHTEPRQTNKKDQNNTRSKHRSNIDENKINDKATITPYTSNCNEKNKLTASNSTESSISASSLSECEAN